MKRKERKNLAALLIVMLLSVSHTLTAGVGEKFNKYVGSEFTNMSGLYIILGVLGFGIVGKLVHHYFMKEEQDKPLTNHPTARSILRHHRHHRAVVKKTS
jgi:hypothetical protein